MLLPPLVVPLEAEPPDEVPLFPLPGATGTVLLPPTMPPDPGATDTGVDGSAVVAGPVAGSVTTDGWVVTGRGWLVTTVGMPVITLRELVWVVKDVKGLVYCAQC